MRSARLPQGKATRYKEDPFHPWYGPLNNIHSLKPTALMIVKLYLYIMFSVFHNEEPELLYGRSSCARDAGMPAVRVHRFGNSNCFNLLIRHPGYSMGAVP